MSKPRPKSDSLSPLVIWGASGHAKVLREFIPNLGFELVALFDNAVTGSPFGSVPLYKGQEGFAHWRAQETRAGVCGMVAIGGGRGRDRIEIQAFMRRHDIEIVQAVHPTAFVAADAVLGEGCQVLAHAVVGVEVRMGEGCIVNTRASVDHECVLGDGVHIAPGATLAGCVQVGSGSLVAVGAVVLPRIKIGCDAIVGAGAIVTRDVPDRAVVYGNPARVHRHQE